MVAHDQVYVQQLHPVCDQLQRVSQDGIAALVQIASFRDGYPVLLYDIQPLLEAASRQVQRSYVDIASTIVESSVGADACRQNNWLGHGKRKLRQSDDSEVIMWSPFSLRNGTQPLCNRQAHEVMQPTIPNELDNSPRLKKRSVDSFPWSEDMHPAPVVRSPFAVCRGAPDARQIPGHRPIRQCDRPDPAMLLLHALSTSASSSRGLPQQCLQLEAPRTMAGAPGCDSSIGVQELAPAAMLSCQSSSHEIKTLVEHPTSDNANSGDMKRNVSASSRSSPPPHVCKEPSPSPLPPPQSIRRDRSVSGVKGAAHLLSLPPAVLRKIIDLTQDHKLRVQLENIDPAAVNKLQHLAKSRGTDACLKLLDKLGEVFTAEHVAEPQG